MEEVRNKKNIYLPIIFSLILAIGIFLGERLRFYENRELALPSLLMKANKIDEILNYIEKEYVDTIDKKNLEEKTINSILQNLDPHSSYISAEDLQATNEPLKGSFDGIGIEFSIIKDTIRVVTPLSGGPSEILGIQAGDKIVKIEGMNAAGVKITNQDVLDKLRGEGGTKVNISVQRGSALNLIDFTITRGKIPIYSVDVAYMPTKTIGYIKISRFAATTFNEYIDAFEKLRLKGMKELILDLRGNPGGLLSSAIQFSDEFLEDGKEIVFTEGRSQPKRIFNATSNGKFEKEKIIVLIDEGSASASEIIAGAIQDNDRGFIVGRRSFGKGLVQEQAELSDGSALRLTVARYYTPTGRCIQKSYSNGTDAYYKEEIERYENGELQHEDSVKVIDSLKYITPKGKVVYGGGGIMPDYFVPIDTIGRSALLNQIIYAGLINQFAYDYADKKRKELLSYSSFENFNRNFNINNSLFDDFISFVEKNKIKKNEKEISISKQIIKIQLKAYISRNIWHNEGFYPIIHELDNAFRKAVQLCSSSS